MSSSTNSRPPLPSDVTIKRGDAVQLSQLEMPDHRSGSVTVRRRDSDGEVKVKEIEMYDSVEPIPDTFWYRKDAAKQRPTIFTLRFGHKTLSFGRKSHADDEAPDEPAQFRRPTRFGTWDGVFARSLLNILGVILFIRAPWVVGQAGIGFSILILLVSTLVTGITTLSMSAISTNGRVRSGGAYYMISRSLGPAFGSVIGILFSVANAIAIALYTLGFCEVLLLISAPFQLTEAFDLRIWSVITVSILLVLAFVGISWVVKVQLLLLLLLLLSVLNYYIGTWVRPATPSIGFVGYTADNFVANWGPNYDDGMSFFTVLAVFFPAVTGIMAGANISGDLKDAQRAIPLGTLSAIGLSTLIYLAVFLMAGATATRAVLTGNYFVLNEHSMWGPLFVAGVFAATLSSAIASLVGAPRVLQAVATDDIFPILRYFAKGSGPENEPRRGYMLSYVIAIGCIQIGSLNFVALLITTLFLLSYGMINWACFSQSMSQAPGWRPSFKFYSPWVSLFGALSCFLMMFLIDWIASLISIGAGIAIYQYVVFRNPNVNWGSALQANQYNDTLRSALRLRLVKDHVKLYRPQVLALTGSPSKRSALIRFAVQLNDGKGLVAAGRVLVGPTVTSIASELKEARTDSWLIQNDLKAFLTLGVGDTLRTGVRSLMLSAGLGKLKPNIVLMGYREGWSDRDDCDDYVGIISDALDLGLAVCCMRGSTQLDFDSRPTGTIDVWWLSDDGGLTLLLPHMLSQSSHWHTCAVRVFTKASEELTADVVMMTRLLRKFRIPAEVVPVQGVDDNPSRASLESFKGTLDASTMRHIRMSELLHQHSYDASIVFVTLPVPSRDRDATQYMIWLDTMSAGMPPTVFIRGTQEDVLTFYS